MGDNNNPMITPQRKEEENIVVPFLEKGKTSMPEISKITGIPYLRVKTIRYKWGGEYLWSR